MSQPTSTLSKFIGLTGLGLLTGSSLTLTLLNTPTLLALPSTQPAAEALTTLSAKTRSLHRILSHTSLLALLAAWTLSPRGARHPYLLWTALPIIGVTGWEFYALPLKAEGLGAKRADVKGKGKARNWGAASEDEDGWREVDQLEAGGGEVNGERVRDGLVALKREMGIKTLVWGVGWGLGIVGIWGDGY